MVAQRPSHIPLPPPFFPPDDLDPPFYSAPSTPDLASPQIFYTPPSSPLPSPPVPPPADDPHPSVDLAFDLALTEDALSTLEKIYLFSSSKAVFHRVFIAQALPSFLDEVSPQEANEYVLPLLTGLALDDGESFRRYMRHLTLFQMSKSKKLWQPSWCLSSGGSSR
jgi:serine/threonine-protein phosphatase 4 regulatory subunit 1